MRRFDFVRLFIISIVISHASALKSRGMPAGHPFQGSQPKHLDAPSAPTILPRSMTDENDFDHEKMMRYDDFSNEDVGNIIMDADPEEPIVKKSDLLTGPLFKDNQNLLQDPEKPRNSVKKQQTKLFNKPKSNSKSFQEQVRDSNSLPGIQEFDEFPYFGNTNANMNVEEVVPVTAGSRPFLYRTRFQPQIQRNFRRGAIRRPILNGQQRLIRNQQPNLQVRRFPGTANGGNGGRLIRNTNVRHSEGFRQKPQLTLQDTFDYSDVNEDELIRDDEIQDGRDYYDDEITFSELEDSELPPKKYKIVPHVRPLRSSNGLAGINHNTPIVDNYNEDHGIGNYPQIPPPNFTGHHSEEGAGFFHGIPDNFPTLHDLTGGGFSNNRRYQQQGQRNNFYHQDHPIGQRRRRRLLLTLDRNFY